MKAPFPCFLWYSRAQWWESSSDSPEHLGRRKRRGGVRCDGPAAATVSSRTGWTSTAVEAGTCYLVFKCSKQLKGWIIRERQVSFFSVRPQKQMSKGKKAKERVIKGGRGAAAAHSRVREDWILPLFSLPSPSLTPPIIIFSLHTAVSGLLPLCLTSSGFAGCSQSQHKASS